MAKKTPKQTPQKTYQSIMNELALKNYLAYKAVWLTRTFRKFCQENQEQVKEKLETRLREISQKSKKERDNIEQIWLDISFDKEMDKTLREAFLNTFEGKQVLAKLKVCEIRDGAISYDRKLIAERYLSIRSIDLTLPKKEIRAEFEHILNKMHPQVKRPQTVPRGAAKMDKANIDLMLRTYKLVENFLDQGENYSQSLIMAAKDIFSKARAIRISPNPIEDKRYRQVKYWHERVKDLIGDL